VKQQKRLTTVDYEGQKMWRQETKGIENIGTKVLFPGVSCLGGSWLCVDVGVVGDDCRHVDEVVA
jgi:hypothetical protein